ncbi:MAG: 50S ribosomal protein L18 [Candidatus Marsarchaeota archaeon]|nr:50S ribosomal protein L18 [Candidatus Marsarchaeota archaeon]
MRNIRFRRRREALTNYKHRLALVKSGMDRIVVRKTNRRIIAQVVRYDEHGDRILKHVESTALSAYKWPARSNRASAYLTGLLLARRILKGGGEPGREYILDIGLSSPVKNSIPFVFARGCTDGGLKLRSGVESDDSIFSIATEYAKKLKEDNGRYARQFGRYIKDGTAPETLGDLFRETREKILKE